MYAKNGKHRLWYVLTAVLLCALLICSVGAEEIAVEDVPVIGITEAAPMTAELIGTAAQESASSEAEAVKTVLAHAEGILQAGDFPAAAQTDTGLALQAEEDPYAEVCEVIAAGLRSRQEEIEIEDYNVPEKDIGLVYQCAVNRNPELFYVGPSYRYAAFDSKILRLMPSYDETYTTADSAAFEAVCDAIVSHIDPDWTDLQKLLFLHDYIVTHCEYDLTYSNYNAYNALIDRSAVCQGYTLAFIHLARRVGLDADFVASDELVHAWNVVTLEGERFYIDCTWDDPTGDWYEGFCMHDNFMLSRAATVAAGHDSSDWICGTRRCYEDTTSTKYDNAWWQDKHTMIAQIGSVCAYGDDRSEQNVYLRDWASGEEHAIPLPTYALWPLWNDPDSCWSSLYYSFAAKGNAFYFTTPESVWRLDPAGNLTQAHALSAEERGTGYLYGIIEDNGKLYYELGTTPCGTSFCRVELEGSTADHILVHHPAAAPTTETVGNVEYWRCSVCGSCFLDEDCRQPTSADAVILPKLTPPTLTVERTAGRIGCTAEVKITLADNPGIGGAVLRLAYAPELTLKSVSVGEALTGLTFTQPTDLTQNPLELTWEGTGADTANGTVLTLTFALPETMNEGFYAVELSCGENGMYADDSGTVIRPIFTDGGITAKKVLRGDADGDGKRGTRDLTFLRRDLAGGFGMGIDPAALDVNGDGKVNVKDVTLVRRFLAGGYGVVLE